LPKNKYDISMQLLTLSSSAVIYETLLIPLRYYRIPYGQVSAVNVIPVIDLADSQTGSRRKLHTITEARIEVLKNDEHGIGCLWKQHQLSDCTYKFPKSNNSLCSLNEVKIYLLDQESKTPCL
jgi:hypothetical protein